MYQEDMEIIYNNILFKGLEEDIVKEVCKKAEGYEKEFSRGQMLFQEGDLIKQMGILITGVILLVVDLSGIGGSKAARDANYGNAMWIGICQGLAVFPGLSRSGLTISAGLFGGFSRTFAVKYSYILSIPAIVGALIVELGEFGSPEMTVGMGFTYVLGMIISAVVGYFVIRFLLRLVQKGKFRYFAFYCFLAGFLSLMTGYLIV